MRGLSGEQHCLVHFIKSPDNLRGPASPGRSPCRNADVPFTFELRVRDQRSASQAEQTGSVLRAVMRGASGCEEVVRAEAYTRAGVFPKVRDETDELVVMVFWSSTAQTRIVAQSSLWRIRMWGT